MDDLDLDIGDASLDFGLVLAEPLLSIDELLKVELKKPKETKGVGKQLKERDSLAGLWSQEEDMEVIGASSVIENIELTDEVEEVIVPPPPLSAVISIELEDASEPTGYTLEEDAEKRCVWVSTVDEDSPASRTGLMCNHRVHLCNGKPVVKAADVADAAKDQTKIDLTVSLYVKNLNCSECGSGSVIPNTSTTFTCTQCGRTSEAAGGVSKALSACRACPDTGEQLSFDQWRERMLRFYAKYAPERVPGRQLDQILRSWAGREDELWERMKQRYGEEPSLEEGTELLTQVLSSQLPPTDYEDPPCERGERGSRRGREKKKSKDKEPESPLEEKAEGPSGPPPPPLSAVITVELNDEHEKLGCHMQQMDADAKCLVVTSVIPGSAASRSPLMSNHRIHLCNGIPVATIADVVEAVKGKTKVELTVSLYVKNLTCSECGSGSVIPSTSTTFTCTQCGRTSEAEGNVSKAVSTCRACPDTGEQLTFDQWRNRMLRFYAKYAPERVPGRQLDQILRSWAGREDELWERMKQRYGEEPSLEEGTELLAGVLAQAAPPEECEDAPCEEGGQNKRLANLKTSLKNRSQSFRENNLFKNLMSRRKKESQEREKARE
eukprot:TRINITY_DN5297_c0_g3_i1.p1 TRINITY_DN5297_c0_g3~~TRINITY_DN5297_c0_g3_i1.p1  ORF type:complete len:609 (+),score=146.67 TRINITY_DN5297_c0_g3_i1:40-1866(+)